MAVLYSYRCDDHGAFTKFFTMGRAERETECPHCEVPCRRDFSSVRIGTNDLIRKAILSSKLEQNLVDQNRALLPDTPRDKFEAAHIGAAKGRIYIGDDTSPLKAINRRAIEREG